VNGDTQSKQNAVPTRLTAAEVSPDVSVIGRDMTHRFRSGQTVRLNRGYPHRAASGGLYQVVRQLPDKAGDPQYRIKSASEPHERVVTESDLQRA
jgi:hypothetical protein